MTRVLTHLLVPPALLVGLVLVGCAAADADTVNARPDLPPCFSSADCAGGAVCEGSVCVPPGPDVPARVHLELDPPERSGYARTQRLDIPLEEALAAEPRILPVPTEYETVVRDATGAPVTAQLAVFGERRIPGRELDVNATVSETSPTVFRLLEGRYVVRVRPTDDRLPGMEVRPFTVRGQVPRAVKEFVLPGEYRRLFGEVTSSVSSADKLAGVSVRAFGIKSGLPSTVSVTDEDGMYEIRLPDTEDTTFRLVATPPASAQPAWGFEQVVRVDVDEDRRRAIHLEPTDDSIRGSGRFQILGTTQDGRVGAPVPNAFVSLTATVTGVIEPPVYEISGITDADGVVTLDYEGETTTQVPLLKAEYVVRVVPPVNTPYTSRRTVIDLTGARSGFVLDEQVTLPQRTTAAGEVRSPLGRPVTGAHLELRPLSAEVRPADTLTDADGRFEVLLDPGPYLLVVRPRGPSDTGELLPVTARAIEVTNAERMRIPPVTVPRGERLVSTVIGARAAEPVPETRVEAFFGIAGQVVSLGRAESDAQGVFSVVLPAP